jgi:hypothetical protein
MFEACAVRDFLINGIDFRDNNLPKCGIVHRERSRGGQDSTQRTAQCAARLDDNNSVASQQALRNRESRRNAG